jgi:hypothetical protein
MVAPAPAPTASSTVELQPGETKPVTVDIVFDGPTCHGARHLRTCHRHPCR